MKKLNVFLAVILMTPSIFSQTPDKMSYQCVVRNASGVLVTNQSVGIRVSILQGSASGTVVYQETYDPDPQTNANGLLTVEIGGGLPVTGAFSEIDWSAGPYFLKTETDPTGGTNFTIIGTTQLLSVPYAFYAKTTGNLGELETQVKIIENNIIDAGIYKVTDIEGTKYKVVRIGNQIWMAENLRTAKYNDGTPIPEVADNSEWNTLTTGAFCWYNNDSASYENVYGKLYNFAAVDTRKICPAGWRVPTIQDWRILCDPFRSSDPFDSGNQGNELIETGTIHWDEPFGTNETGFTALPGGIRTDDFGGIGQYAYFYSSGLHFTGAVIYREMPYLSSFCNTPNSCIIAPAHGLSIRCIKD